MARTIAEIKKEITDRFMAENVIRERYGFESGTAFESFFSRAGVENIMFYCVAACCWSIEKLFDLHLTEVKDIIDELKPHSLRWYASKSKSFMAGKELVPDTDYYDTSGMSDGQIEAARAIKYVAAMERSAVIYLKIAGDKNGTPEPVEQDVLEGFKEYIREVKDAGVVIEIVNKPAEHFRLQMKLYYNPMVLNGNGQSFSGTYPVQDTIKHFIRNLPFNGEYRNSALVDELQKIEGVVIPEITLVKTSRDGIKWETVDVMAIPLSGYYRIYNEETDLNIEFMSHETV
jgi:hypothetical protein